ncbi:hypothetical protein HDC94_001966 [Leifsonia sp. AK011]|uniref:AAA family ATPase n=1 Tax=Leifsonia sp. AK011 TaxID=2723075 RepID=UPI0015C9E9F1|nr:AAA family ATPase [Leifsonia sp. AK011]NYF10810.1 hypothetical protein [Leifsonia sp. AK011]
MTRTLLTTPLTSVSTRRQHWAYSDLVPIGVPTILAGRGGIGKSTILAWLASGLTRGTFPGDFQGRPVSVGFISGEDDLATTLKPRLQAAGANLELIQSFSTVEVVNEDGTTWHSLPTIAEDLRILKEQLREWGTRVLIIDPIVSLMSGDSIKSSDVRKNLDPIAALAAELDIAPIMVMHFGKGAGNASDKVSGSHAFRDIARSVLLLAVDEETDQRILSVDKSNYGLRNPSLAFEVVSADVPTDDGDISVVGRAHLIGETNLTVHELVSRAEAVGQLGDLSTEILAYVNKAEGEVTVREISDELDIPQSQARTYLGRLTRSERITRTGRGRYTRVSLPIGISSVSSVLSNYPNDTHGTDNTDLRNETPCVVCGNPCTLEDPEHGYVHPNCVPVGVAS